MSIDDRELLLNARFRVEIEGLPATGVVEVVLPEARIVGGATARTVQYGPLTLRRALTASSDWYRWWHSARGARAPRKQVAVVVLDREQAERTRWTFAGTLPSAYSVSPLNAARAEVLIETLELTVTGLTIGFDATSDSPAAVEPAASSRPRTRRRR